MVFFKASPNEIWQARVTDPTTALAIYGFAVKWDRSHKHAEVIDGNGDEVYRLTLKPDGCYVCCDHYGGPIGKFSGTIDLMMDIDSALTFGPAIKFLLDRYDVVNTANKPKIIIPTKPQKPPFSCASLCRKYLRKRGIDSYIINISEEIDFISYCSSGVLAFGYDDNRILRNITLRSIYPTAPRQKINLPGSSKYYPQVLKGVKETVVIVEGFIDALALWSFKHKTNKNLPTVIVSSGAGIKSFIENPSIQHIFKKADMVWICDENEIDEDTQKRTDNQHQQQLEKIAKLVGDERVRRFKLPNHHKDLAAFNLSTIKSTTKYSDPY
jgi:hypothetical protein